MVGEGRLDETQPMSVIDPERKAAADKAREARETRRQVLEKLLPRQGSAALRRYGVMLLLSVAIAAMGLVANSAAVVIGAMLIAPLMTPIMTFAAATALGLPQRMTQSAVVIALSTVGSIVLAAVLAAMVPNIEIGSEVLSRTSPDVRDLLVAIAAGAAGAYAIAREEVSTSLPGVAVAVALVPPLAAAGVLIESGRNDLAAGALLLFVTNLLAIIVVGALVLVVTGVVPHRRLVSAGPKVIGVMVATVLLLVATAVVLVQASSAVARATDTQIAVEAAVDDWLSSSSLSVQDVNIDGSIVSLELVGQETPPPARDLVQALVDDVGSDVEVRLRWTERAEATARATDELDRLTVVNPIVDDWVATLGRDYELLDVVVGSSTVLAEVAGPERPEGASAVENTIQRALSDDVELVVRWTQRVDLAAGVVPADELLAGIVDAWIGARGTVSILNLAISPGIVTVDLAAREPLLGTLELERRLRDAFPESGVTLRLAPVEPLGGSSDPVSRIDLE